MSNKFNPLIRALLTCLLVAVADSAAAQAAFPSRSVRFIVPYPPGSGTDIVARMLGPKLAEAWGQQVLVDNRPEAVARPGPAG